MSNLVVLDCTVTVSWFMPDESSKFSQKILSDIINRKISMLAPSLWWFEILNVLKNAVRRKRINVETARKTLFLLKSIPMELIDPEKQGQSGILSLTLSENLSAYDATYLHLATSSGADLFTSDSDLLTLKKKFACIKHPEDYRQLT